MGYNRDINRDCYVYTIYLNMSKMKSENQGGGLIGILRNLRKNKKEELRILVLGLDNSGKTTILKSLSNEVLSLHKAGHQHNHAYPRLQHQEPHP